jgi:hypothetical protein
MAVRKQSQARAGGAKKAAPGKRAQKKKAGDDRLNVELARINRKFQEHDRRIGKLEQSGDTRGQQGPLPG